MNNPVIKLKVLPRFPSSVTASSPVILTKLGGSYNITLDINALVALLPTPVLQPITRTLTAAGPYTALPADEVLIVKQTAGAAFTVNVDWSARTRPLRVVDGKGDANTNNITITPAAGQTQLAIVNYSYVIDGNGGSITLTPLFNGTGAY